MCCRLLPTDVPVFHALVTLPNIRRFLLDDRIMPRAWCDEECERSDALFGAFGLGVWLVSLRATPDRPVGFGGFRVFESLGPEAQLLYALAPSATRQGLATELAQALTERAYARGMTRVLAAVDAPNVSSIRVLERCGFVRLAQTQPGAVGPTLFYAVEAPR